MFTDINQCYNVIRGAIDDKMCNMIIGVGEQQNTEQAKLDNKGITPARSSQVSWIKENKRIQNLVSFYIMQTNRDKDWHFYITDVEDFQYTVYNKDDYYNWHIDKGQIYPNRRERKISFSLILNDEYKGGQLEFGLTTPKDNVSGQFYETDLKKGDMVVFTSFVWHRVKPVESGIRKSLVGWIVGPCFK
tara:strand:- start:9559 stop:10125 length:567 start_codon:yes stop_codon:yes gene_type:complete